MIYEKITIIYFRNSGTGLDAQLTDAGFSSILYAEAADKKRLVFEKAYLEENEYYITVDEKDNFTIEDIKKVADALLEDGTKLYAGARENTCKPGLPAAIFGFLSGVDADDIRTSLFGMSHETLYFIAGMKSSDKSFMLNILLEARVQNIVVQEVKTDVVCAEKSTFSLLTQSFKLYFVFIKFSISAMIAYGVDISTFYLFEQLFHQMADETKVLFATIFSRILTSITTYVLNRYAVFKSHANTPAKSTSEIVRFIILSVAQLIASWLLVWGIGALLNGNDATRMYIKVIVDFVIFVASFTIQRDWVFKDTKGLLK